MKFLALVLALASFSPLKATAAEGDTSFSVSPESAYNLLDETIRGAKTSIDLNIYMITNRAITTALADRAAAGVKVTILMEGETFGGEILLPVKKVLDDLAADLKARSNGNGKFLVMTSNGKNKRRFVFNHGKYMIVDGKTVFASSENITGSAFGNNNYSGGTRGWQIVVENSKLASELGKIFRDDSSTSFGDIFTYDQAVFKVKDPGNSPLPPRKPREVTLFPLLRGMSTSATLCASPKSLDCVLQFIRSAKKELSVEHMSLPLVWVNRSNNKSVPNPIVTELAAAAKRGVKVRVLLNDDDAFGDEGGTPANERNDKTVAWLNSEAGKSRVKLEAAIFNQKALQVNYVHNKGMVADGARVFVSSINGTENSIQNNREVALSVDSKEAAKYFGDVFSYDWEKSSSH